MELNVCAKGKLLNAAETLLLVPPPAPLPSPFHDKVEAFMRIELMLLACFLAPAYRAVSYVAMWGREMEVM